MTPEMMRLHALRLACETAPRTASGVRAEEVVARATIYEIYIAGAIPGSEGEAASRPEKRNGDKAPVQPA